ncbi:Smg-4/UPF3 family-domain-containing protein [Russula earlei]|uniref:Smg-4/UPF3 family-domain-containing protein n=1 Tax=Russula earlei TaxID=71964 RepID=A0ACC0UIK2_9AGAM|nr:Smg-4/UPF3 family-domain-containing protein [Russula earlei]
MSSVTTEPVKKPQSRSKAKEKRQGQSKATGTERLKIVVRRLPPNLPEQIFWQSVQTWVTDDVVLWKEFYPGKVRKKLNKENVHSRAYIAFKTEELVAKFSREYDGHVFKDKAGNESQAVVEFAPYQKLPLEKKKADSRNATIDQDEEYIAFLQALEASSTKPHDTDQLLEMLVASTERPAMPASTPLLDALKAEKSAQRDKEAIQRNHPHYKDSQISKREESKKKATAAPTAAGATSELKQSGESTAPLGKRAAKRAAAAAAQKASAQPGPATQPKAGNAPAAPTGKPSSSPSKGKSARGGKHHTSAQVQARGTQAPKSSSTPPGQAAPAILSNPPSETGGGTSTSTPTSAPALAPASSDNPGRRSRPVLGIASRHFEAALSGAGVSKSGAGKRERGQEKEKEKGPAKDGREKRDGGGRREEDDARAAAPQPGVLPAPTILQREAKQPPSRPSQHAPSADATSPGAAPSPDSNMSPHTHRGGGKRGRGRGRATFGDVLGESLRF